MLAFSPWECQVGDSLVPRVGRVAGGQPALPGRAGPVDGRHAAPVAERGDVPGAVRQPAQRPPWPAAQVCFPGFWKKECKPAAWVSMHFWRY